MGSRIKDLPQLQRPREKAFRYGVENCSNEELLALIISSGYKNNSAKDIAYDILSDNKGLYQTSLLDVNAFLNYKGINKVKALTLTALFELSRRIKKEKEEESEIMINSDYIYEKYKSELSNSTQEILLIVLLDGTRKIIHESKLYKGSHENIPFSFKDLFKLLLTYNTKSFYLLHNHPNGSLEPSASDMILTEEIVQSIKKIKVKMIDHLIVTSNGYFSFVENKIK